jgi:hypothetical protein
MISEEDTRDGNGVHQHGGGYFHCQMLLLNAYNRCGGDLP